jgi:hypothetical protein
MRPDGYDEGVRKALLVTVLSVAAAFGIDPAAREVKTVYLFRMGNGLDQYLASELSKQGVYTVTTDPKQADALLTDMVGEAFEKKYLELYAPPPPEKKDDEKKDDKKDGLVMGAAPRVGSSTIGRGKGTIFLVDRKTRNVLWSMTRQPKHSGTGEMVNHARKIVAGLKKELSGK